MKKIYLLLTFLGIFNASAQTVYSENMGVPTGTTAIATYVTGTAPATFQNASPILYSGTADVRATTVSTGYTGASGGGNIFLTNTIGRVFLIEGINTSAYNTADLRLELGHYKSTAAATNELSIEVSTDGTNFTPLTYTRTGGIGWALVSITSGIPSTTNLRIRFTQTSATPQFRLDDIIVKNVSSSCALVPGTPTTACSANTLGIDTYVITIPFTGGGTASYTISPTIGTVGGDNPNSVASGNITISGTNEGVNNSITITGGTCNFTIPVVAPTAGCKPVNTLPLSEPFNYTAATALNSSQMWTIANSGDDIVAEAGNLTYTGISSTGNRVTFAGAGAESRTPFTSTTTGTVYARFLNSITDLTGITASSPSYSALFTDNAGASTNARIWIRENAGQYQYGLSPTSAGAAVIWSSNLYNVGTTQYLLLAYDFGTNTLSLTENPTVNSNATVSVSLNLSAPLVNIGGFMLRQDTAALTPVTIVDELLIDTVVPDGITLARNSFDAIAGLQVYPNPAKNLVNITSDSFAAKNVEIFNVVGTKVLATTVNNTPVNVAGLPTGIYMVKITEEGKTATRKLVIE